MPVTRNRSEVEKEMKNELGLVPTFFKRIPDKHLDHEWTIFKDMQLGKTHIPNKYKELMGLAIHSATKCRYCTLFHTEAARLFGASEEEIEEAVRYAKMSQGWSAYLNGLQIDYDMFAEELHRITDYVEKKMVAKK